MENNCVRMLLGGSYGGGAALVSGCSGAECSVVLARLLTWREKEGMTDYSCYIASDCSN